jgi:hypothetical protein
MSGSDGVLRRPIEITACIGPAVFHLAFTQGKPADAVYYIQEGRVRLNVVSKQGKEATIALFGPGDFLGASRVSAKPAMQGHFKTGHSRPGTLDVVPIADLFCKSHF